MTTTKTISRAVYSNPTTSIVQGITEIQLKDMLMNHKGCSPVTIVSITDPDMNKKVKKSIKDMSPAELADDLTFPELAKDNPFFGLVKKVSRVNGMIGWSYENAVNKQLAREDKTADFVAKPRKWGIRLIGTPLVENKGNFYLEMKVEKSLDHRYEDLKGNALDDATMAQVQRFIKIRPQSQTQGTDKEIILRDYRLSSILSITYKGTCYLITH